MNFIHVMSVLIGIGGAISTFLFRKGGAYNPQMSTDNETVIPIKIVPETPIPAPTATQRVYDAAADNIGKHLTLDDHVADEVGCAEAVSAVLTYAGYKVGLKGIPSVLGLIKWMQANNFKEVTSPTPGCIITSRTKSGSVAHTGVVLRHGIASNDSRPQFLGKFMQNYTSIDNWSQYYVINNHCDMRFFLPV